jgi:ammonium transporter, Amt family
MALELPAQLPTRLKQFSWVLGATFVVVALSIAFAIISNTGPTGDTSGLTTGNTPSSVVGVAPGTITQDDVNKAQTAEPFATQLAVLVNQNRLGINFVWTLVTGYLVMFMQLGFALVETGFCRRKNALHVMAMNFLVYVVGMTGYFFLGFAFQFGGFASGNLGGTAALSQELHIGSWNVLGFHGFMLTNGTYDVGIAVLFLFQMVFMDTTATIPTGAMAERWKWAAFVVYGLFVSTIIYPIYGNWAWGGGWLSQLGKAGPLGANGFGQGYIDFAGSGVVHAIGGWTALAGAVVLGPRIGKYINGKSQVIPGHNLIFAISGAMILAFGWFGFNPGSTLGASGNGNLRIGMVAVATMLASASGALVSMGYMWIRHGKPDAGMTVNGFLAGLVAITAPSGYVSPLNGFIIGAVAGLLVPIAVSFFENVLHVDDPVGAISVHGVNGMWGQIAVGLFADGTANYGGFQVHGLFYGDPGQLVAQVIGAVVAFAWAFGVSWVFFKVLDMTMGIRVPPAQEIAGLDVYEMGAVAYWDGGEAIQGAWPVLPVPAGSSTPSLAGVSE